jgi:glycosyltransferase involved in cell wall biosynthesis
VPSRNLDVLGRILDAADVQVLIVGSTSTERDQQLADWLQRRGATVWTHVVEHIEEVYQMSDAYIFPVKDCCGAMEMPLSVLEALACGTPVLTTPFGALREHMADTGAVRFFETAEELERELAILRSNPIDTASVCSKAAPFHWESIFDTFIVNLKDSTS